MSSKNPFIEMVPLSTHNTCFHSPINEKLPFNYSNRLTNKIPLSTHLTPVFFSRKVGKRFHPSILTPVLDAQKGSLLRQLLFMNKKVTHYVPHLNIVLYGGIVVVWHEIKVSFYLTLGNTHRVGGLIPNIMRPSFSLFNSCAGMFSHFSIALRINVLAHW